MVSNTDEMNLKCALGKAQSRCRLIRVACMVFAGVYALIWIAATVLALMGDNGLGSTSAVFYSVLHGALFLAMLLIFIALFGDVVAQGAPLSVKQADRLRLIALLALALFFVDLAFDIVAVYQVSEPLDATFDINGGESANTINLNVGMLVFSGIMYSLSAIFRYAALLQQLSDDTV